MSRRNKNSKCPDCSSEPSGLPRRDFIAAAGVGALAYAVLPRGAYANATDKAAPETVVKRLYDSLNSTQRKDLCFDWDFTEKERGLLRTRVSNNWNITKQFINSDYFTGEQRAMVREIFEGLIQPEWHAKIDKQLKDDAGGFGNSQSIAIFGKPGDGKFEFVMTGRHMTLRCDGNSTESVAFGGPIFYGHAASGFDEKVGHPGNVFWEQALAANKVCEMLDGKQREKALVKTSPYESAVQFRGEQGNFYGIPVTDLSADQKGELQKTLSKLIEPYRKSDQEEALSCLKSQGGLDKCHLAFFTEEDLGNDKVWDVWRLEGPSFVWHFRGVPHVHVWVNVASDPGVKLNAQD